jgi:hypothetical protein
MKCSCKLYPVSAKRNYAEVRGPRRTTEHSALACWQVEHGRQPPGRTTERRGRLHYDQEPTPVAFALI